MKKEAAENTTLKRLFFGIEIQAPWPEALPKGRLLDEKHRHLTLAFLGQIPYEPLMKKLDECPFFTKPIPLGVSGWFDACLTLPTHHPHVVAWHPCWYQERSILFEIQFTLNEWLKQLGYKMDSREWLPHATLCRQPFDHKEWKKTFAPLPLSTSNIHLYESIGSCTYVPLWTYPIKKPFEEIEHTADIAFIVRGSSILELYHNGFTALAFKFPPLIHYFIQIDALNALEDVIITINQCMSLADTDIGCPMKAVSFHGNAAQTEDATLEWEMIVDV